MSCFIIYFLLSYLSFAATTTPFNIRFLSDLFEAEAEAAKQPNGFMLAYIMEAC